VSENVEDIKMAANPSMGATTTQPTILHTSLGLLSYL